MVLLVSSYFMRSLVMIKGEHWVPRYMLGFVCNIPVKPGSQISIIIPILQTRKVRIREA